VVLRRQEAEVQDQEGQPRRRQAQYIFLPLDRTSKGILSYKVGKRNTNTTTEIIADLKDRVLSRPHISTDAFKPYREVIEDFFGDECQYGRIIKQYRRVPGNQAARRYSPGDVVKVSRRRIIGHQREICTSHVERVNLSIRMQSRRFTRLTNGFSKKLANHKAAVALYAAHYNFCREHISIGMTPAMAVGLTGHCWTIEELLEQTLDYPLFPTKGQRYGRLTVIDGGRS
jgi:IS1 family transposase